MLNNITYFVSLLGGQLHFTDNFQSNCECLQRTSFTLLPTNLVELKRHKDARIHTENTYFYRQKASKLR